MNNILVVRPDRLGDVILSTPVLKILRAQYPKATITFFTRAEWQSVLRFGDEFKLFRYEPLGRHQGHAGRRNLIAELRQQKFDAAIVLQNTPRVSLAVWWAKIPLRIGPLSHWTSWIVFNRGIRQKRSESIFHEAEYNAQLLEAIDIEFKPGNLPEPFLGLTPDASHRADLWMREHGLQKKKFVVVHPGSRGSARVIPDAMILSCVVEILQTGTPVVISAGPGEQDQTRKMKQELRQHSDAKNSEIFYWGLDAPQPLDCFAALLGSAKAMVAHSTGPLHMAAAMGTRCFGIYSPILVQQPRRWGPIGQSGQHETWTPDVQCPAHFSCLGPKCSEFDCMERFSSKSVVKFLSRHP